MNENYKRKNQALTLEVLTDVGYSTVNMFAYSLLWVFLKHSRHSGGSPSENRQNVNQLEASAYQKSNTGKILYNFSMAILHACIAYCNDKNRLDKIKASFVQNEIKHDFSRDLIK
uniref:Uncharacterized protein n=1 Tax=Glossina austeni TaxID=7395 RepID=A0A1A9VDM0_GLOAU